MSDKEKQDQKNEVLEEVRSLAGKLRKCGMPESIMEGLDSMNFGSAAFRLSQRNRRPEPGIGA